MNKVVLCVICLLVTAAAAMAQAAPDAAELTKLLNDFLAGASRNDPAVHERFWADDLIYTRSAGRRVTKADIMRDLREAPAPKLDDPKTVYTAEDVRIQQYGTTAIVAFRLVATTEVNGAKQVQNLLNSGTFLKRNGKWQVVNWQSTRMPRTDEEKSSEVSGAFGALYESLASRDAARLSVLLDPNFLWMRQNGTVLNRKRFIDALVSRRVRFTKPESVQYGASVFGDTAIVYGEFKPQRLAYTLTFVNQIGGWKAVAMHTSNRLN